MNRNLKKAVYAMPLICSIMLGASFSPAYADCQSNGQKILSTKVNEKNWKSIDDHYSGVKKAIFFHDDKGGLVKFKAGYKHPSHYYDKDLTVLVIEGDYNITLDGKMTRYSKGEYIIIPANTCFSSFSKKGAILAMLGAKPGESKH